MITLLGKGNWMTQRKTCLKNMSCIVSNRKAISQLSRQQISGETDISRLEGQDEWENCGSVTQGASSTLWGPGTQEEDKSLRDFAATSKPLNSKIIRMDRS